MTKIGNILEKVTIGEPQTVANLMVYPLYAPNGHARSYRTLDEAMEAGDFEVNEISEGGSVPSLKVKNTGKLPVLLVVGEELIGAKQNRVLNTSILVPAARELDIPVSCVERGRWAYSSRSFSSSVTTSNLNLRKLQTKNVTESLRFGAKFDAQQSAVWGEVDRAMDSHGTDSHTSSMHDIYEQQESKLKEYLDVLKAPESEGILVVINGEIAGADLFDHAETMKNLWAKIVRGYVLDALERQPESNDSAGEHDPTDTQEFLKRARDAKEEIYDSVGLGQDLRLSSDSVTGSSLFWEEQVVHTSLFSETA